MLYSFAYGKFSMKFSTSRLSNSKRRPYRLGFKRKQPFDNSFEIVFLAMPNRNATSSTFNRRLGSRYMLFAVSILICITICITCALCAHLPCPSFSPIHTFLHIVLHIRFRLLRFINPVYFRIFESIFCQSVIIYLNGFPVIPSC